MNILIVDDEPFFIEELKRIITNYRLENGLLLEAIQETYSGEQALRMIQSARPDVVFSDIRMASIDGLELAQTIQKEWPDLPVVIVSGYPSFDYVREAFRAQVIEYLLKPIDEQALKHLLTNLYNRYELREKEQISMWLQELVTLIRPDEMAKWRNAAPNKYEQFMIGLIRTQEALPPHQLSMAEDRKQEWPQNSVWFNVSPNKWDYLVFIGFPKEHAQLTGIDPNVLLASYISKPELISFIYTPEPVQIDSMASTIEQLYQQMDSTKVIGCQLNTPLRPRSTYHGWKQKEDGFEHLVLTLSSFIATKNELSFRREIDKLFTVWEQEKCNSYIIQQSLKNILITAAKHYPEWTTFHLNRLNKHIEEIIIFATHFEEVREGFYQLMSPLFPGTSELEGEDDSLFLKVSAYITAHLSEPLSLNDIIHTFDLSRTSVWSLFRQHGQTTFIEFLTRKRIEKAKYLIKHFHTMKLKDIAEQVGYMDHHYFSRIFKAITSVTPTEYRNQQQ